MPVSNGPSRPAITKDRRTRRSSSTAPARRKESCSSGRGSRPRSRATRSDAPAPRPPAHLAEQARKVAATHGFRVTVLDKAQIKKEGMGALLAVAQGSAEEPRFIVLEYQGGAPGSAPVALIGKGVTFDSGGISIKPA